MNGGRAKVTEVITIDTDSDEEDVPAPPLQRPTPVVTQPIIIKSEHEEHGNVSTVGRQRCTSSLRGKNVSHVRPMVRQTPLPHAVSQPMPQASVSGSSTICEILGKDGYVYVLSQNPAPHATSDSPSAVSVISNALSSEIIRQSQVVSTDISVKGISERSKAPAEASVTFPSILNPVKISGLANSSRRSAQPQDTVTITETPVPDPVRAHGGEIGTTATAVHLRPTSAAASGPPLKVRRVTGTDFADALARMCSRDYHPASQPATALPPNLLSDWSNIKTPSNIIPMSQSSSPRGGATAVPQLSSGSSVTASRSGKPMVGKKSVPSQPSKMSRTSRSAASPLVRQSSSSSSESSPSVVIVSPKPTVAPGWSSKSLEAMRRLQQMRDTPLGQLSQPVKQEPPELPSPSKGTLAIQRFRLHRDASQPMVTREVKVEVIDLLDDLPDLDDAMEPALVHQEGSAETLSSMEMMFQRTGVSITRCLQSLSKPPRAPPTNSPTTSPYFSSVAGHNFPPVTRGSRRHAAPISAQEKCRTPTRFPAASSLKPDPTPSAEHNYSSVSSGAHTESLDDSVCILEINDDNDDVPTDHGDQLMDSKASIRKPLVSDKILSRVEPMDCDTKFLAKPRQPRIIMQRQRRSAAPLAAAGPSKVAPPWCDSGFPKHLALAHSSTSPNGGANLKAPLAVILLDLRQSFLGQRRQVAPVVESELLNSCCHNILKIYFKSNDVHAAHGLEMLTKLTCRLRRPQPWVVTQLLDYARSKPSPTPSLVGDAGGLEQGPRMRHLIGYLLQLNSSGWLVGGDYELPLWDMVEDAAACLEKEASTVTVEQLELVKLVMLIIEEDLAMVDQRVGAAATKSCTSKNLSPDVFFVRLRKIQNWIVGGLLSGAGNPLISEMLSALSKILALSLCVSQDCESAAMRMAESFCSCYRQLPDLRSRRRLVSLMRPRLVRTLFLSLLLDRMGDTTPVPPLVLHKYVGCKLCLRKVVKFYFRMGGLLVSPPTGHADNDAVATDSNVVEFLNVLATLLETYVLLLKDWRLAAIEAHDFIDCELKRLGNIDNLVLALERAEVFVGAVWLTIKMKKP